jgi:tetratricopeptide (TPR) repeat protein
VSFAHSNLGRAQLRSGQVDEALKSFQNSLTIRERLSEEHPDDIRALGDLAHVRPSILEVQLRCGQADEALVTAGKAVKIQEQLADADPDDAQAQLDLGQAYCGLGDTLYMSGRMVEALATYEKALKVVDSTVAVDPNDVHTQCLLSNVCQRLGAAKRGVGQPTESVAHYQRALDILERLEASGRLAPSHKPWIDGAREELQRSELTVVAIGDWSDIEALPRAKRLTALYQRVAHFAPQGALEQVAETLDRWVSLDPTEPVEIYELACGHALHLTCMRAAHADPSEEQQVAQEKSLAAALTALKAAIAAGWDDYGHIRRDPDLVVLRGLQDFESLFPEPAGSEN